jgi:hypothetical protein
MHLQARQTNIYPARWLSIIAISFLVSCTVHKDVAKPAHNVTITPSSRETEFSEFIPESSTLFLSARGDIDADGDDDVLIVYAPNLATDTTPRALMLLLRNADGILIKSVVNPNAILCRNCGGMMGDPLQQIRVGRGEFTLRFEGGSRELWSSEYQFKYMKDRGIWMLAEAVFSGLDRAYSKVAQKRQNQKDFGDISIEAFDAAALFSTDVFP